ncbi:N-acetyltransferase [uncultured Algibacter sp.]|uniref:N-acetyltransferase n=1 Tax=uncultured Algibacter sp. TaxID=298659 RepID=UPI002618CFEB|nr:N-acetyltransferase [uncultured Algibacter sp.]
MEIIYKQVVSDEELYQILELQHKNIPASISKTEKQKEGFVTVQHDFETLKIMNNACAHSIAKHNNRVVGYALSMVKEFKDTIPVLQPMFEEIETIIEPITSYVTMGQICIEKSYRKQGVFRGLYSYMQLKLNTVFDAVVTEVDTKNIRSLNAHYAVGFKWLKSYSLNHQNWELIIWNWK